MRQVTGSYYTCWARFKLLASFGLVLLSSSALASTIVPYPGFSPENLGKQLNVTTGDVLGPCVTGAVRLVRKPEVSLGLHMDESSAELHSKVHGQLASGLNVGIFGVKNAVEFADDLAATADQASLVLELRYHHGVLKFAQDERLLGCEGGYVSQLNIGARLLVGLVMKFNSVDQKTRFVTRSSYSAMFGLFKGSNSDTKEIKKFTSQADMQVRTLLLGGKSPKIEALGDGITCPPDQKDPCFDYLNSVLAVFSGSGEFRESVERSLASGQYFVTSVVIRP